MQIINFTHVVTPSDSMKNHDSVLIIDDEAEICFLLSSMLKQRKLKASFANTIADGYKQLNEEHGILFLDINLPDGSGLDLLKKVRKQYPYLKIIIISAYDGESERKEAQQNGADAFIGKPFNSDIIFQTIDEVRAKA